LVMRAMQELEITICIIIIQNLIALVLNIKF